MAWFGEGLSSLRGQLSNLAKGVLVEEEELEKKAEAIITDPSAPARLSDSFSAGPSWADNEVDTFIGQEAPTRSESPNPNPNGSTSNKGNVDKDVATMIPKGIANFFQQITTIPDSKSLRDEKETQTDSTLMSSNDTIIQRLTEQNIQLNSENGSLRRRVGELESQVALSQDENANLSTGLEALDIQHQEAIERILTVRDETQKHLEQVREELHKKNEECSQIIQENKVLKKEVENLNQELLATETLAQENARLRERVTEMSRVELSPIEENSALEEHVRTLESEVLALRESRDNLERETNTLFSQVRQRDAQLRQLDARVEEVVNEKEIKEREMTQIVFDCNSLRQEQQTALNKIEDLEKEVIPLKEENKALKAELDTATKELSSVKNCLEAAKREANMSKDESAVLKSELESLKEELGGEEAKAAKENKELIETRKIAKEASFEVEILQKKLIDIEEELRKSKNKFETDKSNFEVEISALQKEMDTLHNISREYGIQNDIFREKELELKRQLEKAEIELSNLKSLYDEDKEQKGKEIEGLKELIKCSKKENEVLRSKLENYNENDKELKRVINEIENLRAERLKLVATLEEMNHKNKTLEDDNSNKGKELLECISKIETYEKNDIKYKKMIDELQKSLQISDQELKNTKEQLIHVTSHKKVSQSDKMTAIEDEEKKFINEKEEVLPDINTIIEKNGLLTKEVENLSSQINSLVEEKKTLEEKLKLIIEQKDSLVEDKNNTFEKEKEAFTNEINTLSIENRFLQKQLSELKENIEISNQSNISFKEKLLAAQKEIETFHEHLKPFGGSFENIKNLGDQVTHLSQQINHFKDELKEAYEERVKLSNEYSVVSLERSQLMEQVHILRRELDNMVRLKEEVENLKHNLEVKSSEVNSILGENKRLQIALNTQLTNNDIIHKERTDLKQRCDNLYVEMQNKMAYTEDVEKSKTKEIESLKQEVDNLKTQLEFASQLLQDVERQEGEGMPSGESNSQKINPEHQEELSKLSAALLKEQTECRLVKLQLEETKEKLEKAENQLKTLKSHLVNVEESYSMELSSTEKKLRETQTLLQAAEERARTSSTAYTSASIRTNQQVEALREQVRLLTEHKEKLEAEVSKAEDATMKQSATVTRLQAVLQQFQRDKQKDIDFETERIRRELALSKRTSDELTLEIKNLQEQLNEAKKGLVAGQRLSEELSRQEELVAYLKEQVSELNEKLKAREEKVNDLSSDNKVDRQLVKNLLVGFVTSPAEHKTQVLGVLGQVLTLSKEERQKVGLEPGGRQQSLSEAFIRFLQAESQPRHEVILPLSVPLEPSSSRKSSLLSQEVPVLPHFPVGRNPGSILKDVLQERRPE